MSKILLRRGNKADLPVLNVGEPGFATDTKELFIGATGGNLQFLSLLSGGNKVQIGTSSVTIAAAGTQVTSPVITFPKAFSAAPTILVSLQNVSGGLNSYCNIAVPPGNIQAGSFTAIANSGSAQTLFFVWMAIGN